MFLNSTHSVRSNSAESGLTSCQRTEWVMAMPPGGAACCRRTTKPTAAPKPVLARDEDVGEADADANLDRVIGAAGVPCAIAVWKAIAQRTLSSTFGNSMSAPSPIVLKRLPPCSASVGRMMRRRMRASAISVPRSSRSTSRV